MKLWNNIFKAVILIIGVIVIAFNAQLYIYCKQQRAAIDSIRDKQDVESEFNIDKFKYLQDQIDRISKDLEDVQQQIKDLKDALGDQKDENKNIQTSLVDTKAEADAIKQDIQKWQKDYASVLAHLEKKVNDAQDEIKSLGDNLVALNVSELKANIDSLKADIEKMAHPADNVAPDTLPAPDKKTNSPQSGPQ